MNPTPPVHGEDLENFVVVALGANVGDPRQQIRHAIMELKNLAAGPSLSSSLWQTAPVDCPPGSPKFINAVVAFEPNPGETPETLLPKLKAIELEFGRRPKRVLNEPRPLDLDLIAFGREERRGSELTLPHPRAHLRRFVLEPLAEIAANLLLPGQDRSVAELLTSLPPDKSLKRLS